MAASWRVAVSASYEDASISIGRRTSAAAAAGAVVAEERRLAIGPHALNSRAFSQQFRSANT
jgi:hypothetical protein